MIFQTPGKMVVLGEYAVLDGAPALVAAIDRGVCCEVLSGQAIEVPAGDDRFVRAALGWDGQAQWGRAPDAHYRFSDWNTAGLPSKAGFGGSAAAVVAARRAAGLPLQDAYAIHRQVQGGGSGIDVFASLNAGCRQFPSGQVFSLPPMIAVWSGQSAATGPRVQQYRAWTGRAGFVAESHAIFAHFAEDPFGALNAAYTHLCAMAAAVGIDYDSPAHRQIHTLARTFGGAAKPSGAGGGDIAIALFPDTAARLAFVSACADLGLICIPTQLVPPSNGQVLCP